MQNRGWREVRARVIPTAMVLSGVALGWYADRYGVPYPALLHTGAIALLAKCAEMPKLTPAQLGALHLLHDTRLCRRCTGAARAKAGALIVHKPGETGDLPPS